MNISNFRVNVAALALAGGMMAGTAFATESITNVAVDEATPFPGQTITVTVDATLSASNDDWESSTIELVGVAGSDVCISLPNILNQGGSFQQAYSYTIPGNVADGPYDVQVSGWKENGCNNDFDGTATGTAAINVVAQVNMGIGVAVPVAPVVAGSNGGVENHTYTITITNAGPNDATGVTVTTPWTLPAGVTPASYTADVGLYDYSMWDVGPVASGASLDLQVVLSVASSAEVCTNCIQLNDATVVPMEFETVPLDNTITVQTSIDREFDLGLAVVDAPDPVLAGSGMGNLTHTFTLSRSGPSDADGVEVDIAPTLPAVGVTPDSFIPSVGSMNGLVWEVGPWAASENGNDQTLVLTLTVDDTAAGCTGCVSAEGTVSAAAGTDTNPANDTAVDPTSIVIASDETTIFDTSIIFLNGDTGTVTATLSCNAGLPLEQTFEISEAAGVNFTMTDLPFTTAGTECEITVSDPGNGYNVAGSANAGQAADSCVFDVSNFATDGMNTCAFVADPIPTALLIETDFEGADSPTIDEGFTTTLECTNVSADAVGPYGTVSVDFVDIPAASVNWYAAPGTTSECTVELMPDSDAVQSDECAFSFVLGDAAGGCTVVGTVFFEGIPTLSQYGMALMALLMLGVGFVGFRRFI